MRTLRMTLLSLISTLILLSSIVVAAEKTPAKKSILLPPDTLNAKQVEDLFVNKTVESITAVKGRVSLSYYDPSGELRQLRLGEKRFGHWRITKNGRICLQMEGSREKCRIIVKEKGTYKKYIVRKNGDHQHSVSYRSFKEGNPLGL